MVFLPENLVDSQQSGFSSPDAGVPTVSPTAGGEGRVPGAGVGGGSTPSASRPKCSSHINIWWFSIASLPPMGHYYPQVAFVEASVIMPHSTLSFIINGLLALVEIKTQCLPGFPFQTHPHIIMLSVTSLMMFGLASVAELIVLAVGLDRTSVYAIIARLGKIGSLCALVASLVSLFYI
ncbi:hypothetical protein R6Q59_000002 [Mikania micrantha]